MREPTPQCRVCHHTKGSNWENCKACDAMVRIAIHRTRLRRSWQELKAALKELTPMDLGLNWMRVGAFFLVGLVAALITTEWWQWLGIVAVALAIEAIIKGRAQ